MLSIITPVYNGERFIESCIRVVIDQAYPDVEHIIVDGGSTDRTVEIVKLYAEQYPHIRWISEKDKGQSDAMNKGIAMAKGEIMSILNVDDFYEPNVLNRASEIIKTLPEPSLIVGNCNIWNNEGKLTQIVKPAKLKLIELLRLYVNPFPINPSSYFYHTSLHQKIGSYKVDDHYAMDLDFILRSVQVATVKYVDETWGNWRLIKGTKSDTLWEVNRQGELVLDRMFRAYRKNVPLLQRWQLDVAYMFDKPLYTFNKHVRGRVIYYSSRPQDFLSNFNSKFRAVLNGSIPLWKIASYRSKSEAVSEAYSNRHDP